MLLKIGALAKHTGLTIRTLRHYDDVGLLVPSHRSEAGYRMYGDEDIHRLHRICALKQLGLGLAEIGETLANNGADLGDIIARQLAELDRQAEQMDKLRAQLLRLQAQMEQGAVPEMADWLITLELMTMYEKYFNPDELQTLEAYRRQAGPDLDGRWAALMQSLRALMDQGVPPHHERAQEAAAEWFPLIQETIGDDTGLLTKLDAMARNEPSVRQQLGMDEAVMDYLRACLGARNAEIYRRYLTPQELEKVMQGRAKTWGQWPPVVSAMRKLYDAGAAVTDPEVREVAAKWKVLFDVTHAGDDGTLRAKLRVAYIEEPELLRGSGLDLPLLEYVGRAMAAL
ncbi:MAG TPA: MerR family transcriptional regulator [Burkholderiaceae bacterium]